MIHIVLLRFFQYLEITHCTANFHLPLFSTKKQAYPSLSIQCQKIKISNSAIVLLGFAVVFHSYRTYGSQGGAGTWSDGKLVTRIGKNSSSVKAVSVIHPSS